MTNFERNIEVFEDTRKLSQTKYKKETSRLLSNTEVIVDGSLYLKDGIPKEQGVEVVKSGTVSYILSGVVSKTAVLSFADALEPGGLVLVGETTQEEALCRCSNLYESLILDSCKQDYYEYNAEVDEEAFTDRIIYSKGVTFFKDESYKEIHPVMVDVITVPFPLGHIATEEIILQRIKCILGSAYIQGVDTLVLGAIGCGVFGCNPHMIAGCFKQVLDEYKLFDKVVFAIRETPDIPDDNYEIFRRYF